MRKLITFAAFLLLLAKAFAAGSISITGVSIPSSVTQGDSFTITAYISGSGVTDVSSVLALPEGISCTPSGSQSVSLEGGSGSASWSCSAILTGDYTGKITVTVTGKDTGTGATVSDSAQTGLLVLSPASLVAASSLSSSSVEKGNSVTLTIGVNNLGDSPTTCNITLNCPSGVKCSPSSVTGISIPGKGLVYSYFTLTGNSPGTYTITAIITSPVQSEIELTEALIVTSPPAGAPSGGGGGTGGGTGGIFWGAGAGEEEAGEMKENILIEAAEGAVDVTIFSVSAGEEVNVSLKNFEIPFTGFRVLVSKTLQNVEIRITPLPAPPENVEELPNAYRYLLVETENLTDEGISEVNISFRVNKTWISENRIDANTVKLYRWNGSWQALPTSRTGEDENFFYFSAVSPGFSVFAISGERMVEPKKCPPCPEPTPWSECVNGKRTRINYVCSAETNYECKMIVEEEPCEVKEEEKPQPNTIFLFLLALAIITGIVAGILAKKKEVLKRLRARFKKT